MFGNNTPVLIKPLGIVVKGDHFGPSARLFLQKQERFEIVRDHIAESPTVLVRRTTTYKAGVTFTLIGDMLMDASAEAFNALVEQRLTNDIENEIDDRARARVMAKAKPTKRGPGRPRAEETESEPEAVDEESEDDYFNRRFEERLLSEPKAYTLWIEELVIGSNEVTPFVNSAAFASVTANLPKNEERIRTRLAQIVSLYQAHARKSAELSTFGDNAGQLEGMRTAAFAGDDLEDAAVGALDTTALNNARQNLRNQISVLDDQIRSHYTWLEERVVDRHNATAPVEMLPFAKIEFSDKEALDPSDIIQEMYKEVLVPIVY